MKRGGYSSAARYLPQPQPGTDNDGRYDADHKKGNANGVDENAGSQEGGLDQEGPGANLGGDADGGEGSNRGLNDRDVLESDSASSNA